MEYIFFNYNTMAKRVLKSSDIEKISDYNDENNKLTYSLSFRVCICLNRQIGGKI